MRQRRYVLALLIVLALAVAGNLDSPPSFARPAPQACTPAVVATVEPIVIQDQQIAAVRVSVQAQASVAGGDRLMRIAFTRAVNAVVEVDGVPTAVPSVVTLQPPAPVWTFVVRRVTPGQSFRVDYVATDLCGDVPKFAGAGTGLVVTPTITPTRTPTVPPTATATRTPPPSPTTTPANPCSPRPYVDVTTTPNGSGALVVTVFARTTASLPTNTLSQLRFGAATNALIDAGGFTGMAGNFTVTLPAGTQRTSFFVRQMASTTYTSVPFVAVDACGDWATVVDGAPSTFAPVSVFFVNMYPDWRAPSSSQLRYEIGRYIRGEASPVGPVASPEGCILGFPSVTRDSSGLYWLYATEHDCVELQWVVAFTSTDGVNFTRHGPVIRRLPGEGQMRAAYVVYDAGVFRAWFATDAPGMLWGQNIYYAESTDGLNFQRIGGIKATISPDGWDSGAIGVDTVVRDDTTGEWYAFFAGMNRELTRLMPGVLRFRDPRQEPYEKIGPIASPRPRLRTQLVADATAGALSVAVADATLFRVGDLVVVTNDRSTDATASRALPEHSARFGLVPQQPRAPDRPVIVADAAQVVGRSTNQLYLSLPLRSSYQTGDTVVVIDARKISLSYVCRASDGTWLGIFTVFNATPLMGSEYTLAYRAPGPTGPWQIDYTRPAPVFSPYNNDFKVSVENPDAVTTSPSVQSCS